MLKGTGEGKKAGAKNLVSKTKTCTMGADRRCSARQHRVIPHAACQTDHFLPLPPRPETFFATIKGIGTKKPDP